MASQFPAISWPHENARLRVPAPPRPRRCSPRPRSPRRRMRRSAWPPTRRRRRSPATRSSRPPSWTRVRCGGRRPSSRRRRASSRDRARGRHGAGRRRGGRGRLEGLQAGREVAAQGHARPARPERLVEAEVYDYQTSPNEKRDVGVLVGVRRRPLDRRDLRHGQAVGEKRGAQVALIFDRLLPKGYVRETFAGKKAHKLDARAARGARPVHRDRPEGARASPASPLGIVQDGKVVFAGGFGVRELGKPETVDGDTLLHDRLEYEGADDAAAGEARGRRQDDLGHAGHEPPARVQARRRRDHAAGQRAAAHLRVHRAAAAGPGVALRVQERHARRGPRDARDDAADEQVRRALPVLQPDGRRRRLHRRPRALPRHGARRRVRQGDADAGVRPARHEVDDLRLRARPRPATTPPRTRPTSTASRRSR